MSLYGKIHFEEGSALGFVDLVSLIFVLEDGAESIPQNVSEWPRNFDPASRSRSAPLQWVRSIEVRSYQVKDGYRCMFSPEVEIVTTSGNRIVSRYATLEWVRVVAESGRDPVDRTVYFVAEAGRRIRKIELARR